MINTQKPKNERCSECLERYDFLTEKGICVNCHDAIEAGFEEDEEDPHEMD